MLVAINHRLICTASAYMHAHTHTYHNSNSPSCITSTRRIASSTSIILFQHTTAIINAPPVTVAVVVVFLTSTLVIVRTARPAAISRPICASFCSSPYLRFSCIITITAPSALVVIKTARLFPATKTQKRIPPRHLHLPSTIAATVPSTFAIPKTAHKAPSIKTTHAFCNDACPHEPPRPEPPVDNDATPTTVTYPQDILDKINTVDEKQQLIVILGCSLGIATFLLLISCGWCIFRRWRYTNGKVSPSETPNRDPMPQFLN